MENNRNIKLGKVNWINNNCGSILGDDGNMYRIHEFTKILGTVSNGSRVGFELSLSSVHPVLTHVVELKD